MVDKTLTKEDEVDKWLVSWALDNSQPSGFECIEFYACNGQDLILTVALSTLAGLGCLKAS